MKCEICEKEILRDSQCINYKYYHNDCIENLQQENKKYKEVIDRAIEYINKNKNKTYAPYGDNEDYDYEVCLNEDEIKDLLEIIGGKDE